MKSAVYEGNKAFSIGESQVVKPGPGEVRLKVAFCGVCGTDLHVYHGSMDQRVKPPVTIGHEVSATVAEIGEGVTNVAVGDAVAVRPLRFGDDDPSDNDHAHVGKNLKFIGLDSPGGMQESWTVPAYTLHKLPEGMSLLNGALVEPTAVACHDVRLGEVKAGEHVVVIGSGPIGMLIALVAKDKGAKVLVSEVNNNRVAFAKELGLDAVNPIENDLVEFVTEWSGGAMADVVFEVSGAAKGVEAMTQIPRARGRIVMVAIHPESRPVDLFKFFWRELKLIGTRLYEPCDYDEAIELLASGRVPSEPLITQVSPLEKIQEVFATIDANPEGMKYVLQCSN